MLLLAKESSVQVKYLNGLLQKICMLRQSTEVCEFSDWQYVSLFNPKDILHNDWLG